MTTNARDGETRLHEIVLHTMSYHSDNLRARLVDEEGDQRVVWDSQGSSGYQDLLEEATE